MNEMTESTPAQETLSGFHHKLQFAALCAMLALALVGVWLSEAQGEGARGYWMLVVFIYASLGIFRVCADPRYFLRPERDCSAFG